MKKKLKLHVFAVFILACFAVCITACDKDDDDNGNGNGTSGYHMTAKIDGQTWASAPDQLILVDDKNGYLFISGAVDEDLETMTIQMFDYPGGTGSFPLGTGEYEAVCFYTSPDDITYYLIFEEQEAHGMLEITSYASNYIAGKFTFTAIDPSGEHMIEVTEGSFHMPVFQMPD